MHAVIGNMLCAFELNPHTILADPDAKIETLITDMSFDICSLYHFTLEATPGAAIFGSDMLFDVPSLTYCKN